MASQGLLSDDEGQIYLSHPHTNNELFFLLTTKCLILYWQKDKKKQRPEYP